MPHLRSSAQTNGVDPDKPVNKNILPQWEKCTEEVKRFNFQTKWQPISYPSGKKPSHVKSCIVLLFESGDQSRDSKDLFATLDTNFNDMFHYPIFVFHFNLTESETNAFVFHLILLKLAEFEKLHVPKSWNLFALIPYQRIIFHFGSITFNIQICKITITF